jgi:dienelactone hydrolase
MTFGDYLVLSGTRDSLRAITEQDRTTARDGLKAFAGFGLGLQITDSQATSVFSRRLAAIRDAAPTPERHPVVIAGVDGGVANQAPLFESLAQRGYVVIANASLPSLASVQVTNPAAAIDTRIRDLEYLTAHARKYPFVDADRLAVLGINFDGMAALVYQMKNMRADAVISIDGWEGKRGSVETVRASPFYEPRRMRVPYFLVLQNEPNPPPGLAHDLSIFDALKYGAGEHVVARGLTHAYLVGAGAIFTDAPSERRTAHELLMRRIASFLDASLKRSSLARVSENDPSIWVVDRRHNALKAVPDAEEVERVAMADRGAERLRDIFRDARRENPEVSLFSRTALNLFAFRMSRANRTPESLTFLELATEAFPRSALAQNDLGNGYLQTGDTTRAVQAFERSVALLPSDSSMSDADRTQSQSTIAQKIDRLRRKP